MIRQMRLPSAPMRLLDWRRFSIASFTFLACCTVLSAGCSRWHRSDGGGIFVGTVHRVPGFGHAAFLQPEAWPMLPASRMDLAVGKAGVQGSIHSTDAEGSLAEQGKSHTYPTSAPLFLILEGRTGRPIPIDWVLGERVTLEATVEDVRGIDEWLSELPVDDPENTDRDFQRVAWNIVLRSATGEFPRRNLKTVPTFIGIREGVCFDELLRSRLMPSDIQSFPKRDEGD